MIGGVQIHLDTASLAYAMQHVAAATGQLPRQIINRAVWSIAYEARKKMPVTSISKIDSELGTATLLQLKKRGKGFKRTGKITVGGKQGAYRSEDLAKLIFLARANKAGLNRGKGTGTISNFNVTTNSRWSVRAFTNKAIDSRVSQMIKNRHQTTGYFQLCAHAIQLLYQNSDRGMGSFGEMTFGGKVTRRIGKIAGGVPAKAGLVARASFWVSGTKAETNKALNRVARPVWQSAIDREAGFMYRKAASAYKTELSKLGFRMT